MGLTRLTLPRLGETMEEARVTDWLVAPDQAYARGDVLLEVETDKTVVEVPALSAGIMRAHLVGSGDLVEIGQPIAEVESEGADPAIAGQSAALAEAAPPPKAASQAPATRTDTPATPASPRARRLAAARGLDIGAIPGTGRRGRVTGADVAAAGTGRLRQGGIACDRHGTDTGAGAVVLLHGLFSSGTGFGGLPARLARSGAQVLVPDLPGHGDSPAAAGLEGAEAALIALIAALAPKGPLRLVGHSLGAILATRLARHFGDRVALLVLLAPAGLAPRINRDFLDILCEAQTPAALRRGLAMLGGGPVSDEVLAQELARLLPHRAAQRALVQELAAGGVQQIDIAPEIAALATPVRALFGTADQVLDWHACARLPVRAAIHLRKGAGHLPHLGSGPVMRELIFG